jgi:hypothetical protein
MLHWDDATRERGRAQDKTATDTRQARRLKQRQAGLTALIQRSGRLPLQLETQELGVRSQAATNVDTTGTTTDFMLRQILDSRA